MSSPSKGDLIAYFNSKGDYIHTGTYLGDGKALQGNWSNGRAVITSSSYGSYQRYFRLGAGSSQYCAFINDKAHELGGNAGWLEGVYNVNTGGDDDQGNEPEPKPQDGGTVDTPWEDYVDQVSDEEKALIDACDASGDPKSEACQIYLDYYKKKHKQG